MKRDLQSLASNINQIICNIHIHIITSYITATAITTTTMIYLIIITPSESKKKIDYNNDDDNDDRGGIIMNMISSVYIYRNGKNMYSHGT